MNLLRSGRICATVATRDLDRARVFYEQKLGLAVALADERRGVYYRAADGTTLNLYERDVDPPAQSVATFLVDDLSAVMTELRERGVTFEEYDEPDLKTIDGVYTDDTGFAVAWCEDDDGNVLGFEQLP